MPLRHALNVLAEATPVWLLGQVPPDWFDRFYEARRHAQSQQKGAGFRQRYAARAEIESAIGQGVR